GRKPATTRRAGSSWPAPIPRNRADQLPHRAARRGTTGLTPTPPHSDADIDALVQALIERWDGERQRGVKLRALPESAYPPERLMGAIRHCLGEHRAADDQRFPRSHQRDPARLRFDELINPIS